MTLTLIDNALGRSRTAGIKDLEDISGVLDAVQRVADTLTPPRGGRYIVALKDADITASTDLMNRRIVITAKPLRDSSLTQGQAAEVLAGLACHEIGHTVFDGLDWALAVHEHNSHPAYSKLSNLLSDVRLEDRMGKRYPMIKPTFGIMLRWVSKWFKYEEGKALVARPTMKPNSRFNFAVAAVRYPWGVNWSADPLTRAERARWRAWAAEYSADDTLATHIAGLDVAFGWLFDEVTPEPTPEQDDEPEPIIDEPEPLDDLDDEDDEDEDEPFDDEDEDDGEDESDEDEDEPWDEGPDEDEINEVEPPVDEPIDEPEPPIDEPEPTDEPPINEGPTGFDDDEDDEDEDEDEPKPGESKPGEPDDEDADDEDEEDGEQPTDEPGENDDHEENGESTRPEWREDGPEAPDTHSHATREYDQDELADRIARFDQRARITFGHYGSMTSQWH